MRYLAHVGVAAGILVLGFSAVQAADQKQPPDQQKQTVDQKQTTDAKKSADQKQEQPQEQWRYTFHNGEWWYWLPKERWVYWRNNRWNDYDTATYVAPSYAGTVPSGVIVTGRSGVTNGSAAVGDSEIRPYYGHAESTLDRRTLQTNEEVGPFYGRAMPDEFIGPWRSRRANRPFYGHAVSSGD